MTDAEIAGFMNWRGPGAYTASQLAKVRRIVEEVQRREREACAHVCNELHWTWRMGDNSGPKECAAAIEARGKA